MQQLTFQFDGFAQVQQPIDASAAKRRTKVQPVPELRAEYQALVRRVQSLCTMSTAAWYQAKTWCLGNKEQLEVYVGGPAIAVSCFLFYLLAAVLQGGAE